MRQGQGQWGGNRTECVPECSLLSSGCDLLENGRGNVSNINNDNNNNGNFILFCSILIGFWVFLYF